MEATKPITDKTKCPDCGGPVEPIHTSSGTGYYCRSEDKFIGDYYEGPTEKELNRKFDREETRMKIILIIPIIIFTVLAILNILQDL